jgi:CheY-like chemotaxis protein
MKMKRILLIEDDGALAKDLLEDIKSKYEVKSAYSYASAIGFWNKYKGEFNCIILDLNINPEGLAPEITAKYFPVQGIAILEYICESKSLEKAKQIWSKTIIYSGYIDTLKEKRRNFKHFDSLKLIPKTGPSIYKVLDSVEQILQLNDDKYEENK